MWVNFHNQHDGYQKSNDTDRRHRDSMYVFQENKLYFHQYISAKGCKPTAPPPTTTVKPKPKRKCPYGTTYICPSFEDGSCLPKQVAVCFKEGKMGKEEEPTGEMPVEMTTVTSRAGEVEAYKPSKEEREDVIGTTRLFFIYLKNHIF